MADIALAIGRVVPGVYNKVMNIRAIDQDDGKDSVHAFTQAWP